MVILQYFVLISELKHNGMSSIKINLFCTGTCPKTEDCKDRPSDIQLNMVISYLWF